MKTRLFVIIREGCCYLKEELDKCSTCDMCATINDGLSAAKEQLVGKIEVIVDADIAKQMEK